MTMKKLGGAWKAVFKKSGKPYLDITKIVEEAHGRSLNGQKVWLMPNDKRPGKKDPDYSAVIVPPLEDKQPPQQQQQQQRPPQGRYPGKQQPQWDDGGDDEIPF